MRRSGEERSGAGGCSDLTDQDLAIAVDDVDNDNDDDGDSDDGFRGRAPTIPLPNAI